MEKQALKDLLYGGIQELMRNRRYYHVSSIGKEYCRWTEEGQVELAKYMAVITGFMLEAEERDLDNRSKEILLKELKT